MKGDHDVVHTGQNMKLTCQLQASQTSQRQCTYCGYFIIPWGGMFDIWTARLLLVWSAATLADQ